MIRFVEGHRFQNQPLSQTMYTKIPYISTK